MKKRSVALLMVALMALTVLSSAGIGAAAPYPSHTTLYASNLFPPRLRTYDIYGTTTFRHAGKFGIPNGPVYIYIRVYNVRTKSWGPWKFFSTCPLRPQSENTPKGFFELYVKGAGLVQWQARLYGTNTFRGSSSAALTVYQGYPSCPAGCHLFPLGENCWLHRIALTCRQYNGLTKFSLTNIPC